MKTRIIRTAALAFASFSLLGACKKGADEAPSESASPSGPIEVAPVPVEQEGVLRYADEIAITGQAKTNALTNLLKGTDTTSALVASLDADVAVEKKARRGDHVLVSWSAEPGQPSLGWAPVSSFTDQGLEPVILPVDAGPAPEADAAAAPDAAKIDAEQEASTDAGAVEAGTPDAGAADDKAAADAGTKDAGTGESAAATDAGQSDKDEKVDETAKGEAKVADAGASDGGGKLIRLPIKSNLPVLKLPGKLEVKPKE